MAVCSALVCEKDVYNNRSRLMWSSASTIYFTSASFKAMSSIYSRSGVWVSYGRRSYRSAMNSSRWRLDCTTFTYFLS
jgi:hypothetical protein